MKKYTYLFLLFFAFSCVEDGDWDVNQVFTYTVERDHNFIEKGILETNTLTFNVNTNYDFEKVPMFFKYTTSLNGVLKLNGEVLLANQTYELLNPQNIFEYVGNVTGMHKLEISLSNDKGITLDEVFNMPYATSDFSHTYIGGSGTYYQGDQIDYSMKIIPGEGQPTTGYQIKINDYSGDVKLNNISIQENQYYDILNIENFSVSTQTNQSGTNGLHYTIKNSTVSKDFNIQQNILSRGIIIESMNFSNNILSPGQNASIIGVVQKNPNTGVNNIIEYKTWISQSSNNNTIGIENTNNIFMPYELGANGNFNINFNALISGDYTYNIQFRDEFGNLSEVKSFSVTVQDSITVNSSSVNILLNHSITDISSPIFGPRYNIIHKYKGVNIKVDANTNLSSKISKVELTLSFYNRGELFTYNYVYLIDPHTNHLILNEYTNENILLFSAMSVWQNAFPLDAIGESYLIKVYTNQGLMFETNGVPIITTN